MGLISLTKKMYKRVFLSLKNVVKQCFLYIKMRKFLKNVKEKTSYIHYM